MSLGDLLPRLEGGLAVLERLSRLDVPARHAHVVGRVEPEGELLDAFGDHDGPTLGQSRREIKR